MNILVFGGTRYFGVHLVDALLFNGHTVTIATRGKNSDNFGDKVNRITIERTDGKSILHAFNCKHFDAICDNLAYCSNDVKSALDNVNCNRYIMTSSASIYNLRTNTLESDFIPLSHSLLWCNRLDLPYNEAKRSAESALFQAYPNQESVSVRYPYVIGKDDYTNRLYFYVECVVKSLPIKIDNLSSQMSFISSSESGKFIAWLTEQSFTGSINGANCGTISLLEIINYVESKTKRTAIYSADGNDAPYNGTPEYSINTDLATTLGFNFSPLKDWIYDLLDIYIERATM